MPNIVAGYLLERGLFKREITESGLAQGLTGCGSRQRSGPTGGCANGMPLNAAPPPLEATPAIVPAGSVTVGGSFAAFAAVPIVTVAASTASLQAIARSIIG